MAVGLASGFFLRENIDMLLITGLVGLVGALLATGVAALANLQAGSLSWAASTVIAALGAIIALLLFSGLQKASGKHATVQGQTEQEIPED